MATTLNGWPAVPRGDARLVTAELPALGRRITVAAEVLPIFRAALRDVHEHVIDLTCGPLDGHEFRQARMAKSLSNHASGTAVDMRYDVWLADGKRHCTKDQIDAMHGILDRYRTPKGKRILGWGGDWKPGHVDEMHLEIGQAWQPGVGSAVTRADVRAVVTRLRLADGDAPADEPGGGEPAPAAPRRLVAPTASGFPNLDHLVFGTTNDDVRLLQQRLVAKGFPVVVDGGYGPRTRAAVAAFQRSRKELRGDPDGLVGPLTLKLLFA